MYATFSLLQLATLIAPLLAIPVEQQSNSLEERQSGAAGLALSCDLVAGSKTGDAYYDQQVTDVIDCGAGTCSVSKINEHTFGYSIGGGVNNEFVSLDASVTEEWTSGTQYQCDGEKGQKACVWVKVAYTTYNLEADKGMSCSGPTHADMTAPNTNNVGGEYYCVYGDDCKGLGLGYWEPYNGQFSADSP
ncbi:MAG: hypothetical protein OHK93_008821 [Ramalina farinacea]|uniref:Uncharacterized protein n=1 Tax=Ramalina farinacea TaxID=258253 RepID=A0AA43TWZ5_9LECA|nr:hypothetical protein [Ramalina farinacea]